MRKILHINTARKLGDESKCHRVDSGTMTLDDFVENRTRTA